MKRLLSILLIAFTAISFSCKKNNDASPSSPTITQGSWKVKTFTDNSVDETNHFSGYTFVFASGGTVNVSNGGMTLSGTWSNTNDNSGNQLVMNFGSNQPCSDLNEDWKILEQTTSVIRLEHISGGNGGTKELTFEKN